ncbi:MAG: right-handed parallel beta-helix repeat-containing protein [Verrucomicrobia bacterium]|nr:right-handed parallel beta-helix repeat-containing protein [Verrucomicrobiota bacterium]
MIRNRIVIMVGLFVSCSAVSGAETYYVTVSGSDGDSGSETQPWRSLGKAAAAARAGDIVLVGAGVYNEVLKPSRSGTVDAWIEFAAKPGEVAVIDGTGVKLDSSNKGLIFFGGDISYIRVRAFEVRNANNDRSTSRDPIGVAVRDDAHHIEVIDCRIHSITTDSEDLTPKGVSIEGQAHDITIREGSVSMISTSESEGNAHAIAVYGERSRPIDAVRIEAVEMFELALGTSESLVFNGNVTNFTAVGNRIHDSNNIGIDVIGFEGVGPSGQDQARNGLIADNVVYNISTLKNKAYEAFSAAGIYVDGGRDLVIERNRVYNCDIGVELASENSNGVTRGVVVRDNLVWRNAIGGILLGGYDRRRGATEDCIIANNTFFENDTQGVALGEVNIRYRTNNNVFVNNIFNAGEQGYFVTLPKEFADSKENTFDGNGYFTSSRILGWEWQGKWASSWSAFKRISQQEAAGVFEDPQFESTPDKEIGLSLKSGSPMIDAGVAQSGAGDRVDVAGNSRLSGSAIDIGAFEFASSVQPVAGCALAITEVADRSARALSFVPGAADLDGVQLQFSTDGRTWSSIASYSANGWTLTEGIRSEATTLLIDSRPLGRVFNSLYLYLWKFVQV